MHESLDEFKFRPDTTTNTRVICPCASEILMYNVVTTLAPSFLIGSSSYLLVMRTVFLFSILGMGAGPSELGKSDVKYGNWEKL